MSECKHCPNGSGFEHYRLLLFDWDVAKARQFVAGREAQGEITPEQLKKYGLPVEKPEPRIDADGTKWFTLSAFGVNEEHLEHIPADRLEEPVLVAPLVCKGDRSQIIIDGTHRAVKLARQGKSVKAVALTDAESLACLNIGPGDRKQLKVFPRVKPAVLEATR